MGTTVHEDQHIRDAKEYERLRERDRLVAVGEMAAGMAHEIRNPLGAIKGAAQCLEPETLPEDANEFVHVIVEEVDRLNGYKLGCNSYIQKPIDFEQLSGAVCQLGLYWMLLNEPPPRLGGNG